MLLHSLLPVSQYCAVTYTHASSSHACACPGGGRSGIIVVLCTC